MSYTGQKDMMLEIARGNVPGQSKVNKFGLAPDGVQTTPTDIWDRADAAATQQIWVAPTQARIHAIVSDDTDDDGSPVGVGARTVQVYGLTTWGTNESSEIITMNGTTPVNTASSYVIIHRMKVITCGATAINVGTITATAATDGTVTAQINPLEGQTQMAIYGIPSTQVGYMTGWTANAHNRANPGTTTEVDFSFWINEAPDVEMACYKRKSNSGTTSSGGTNIVRKYEPYFTITGPAIIKFQGVSSAADIEASAEFDIILVDN